MGLSSSSICVGHRRCQRQRVQRHHLVCWRQQQKTSERNFFQMSHSNNNCCESPFSYSPTCRPFICWWSSELHHLSISTASIRLMTIKLPWLDGLVMRNWVPDTLHVPRVNTRQMLNKRRSIALCVCVCGTLIWPRCATRPFVLLQTMKLFNRVAFLFDVDFSSAT